MRLPKRTLPNNHQKGRPRSRAKDQYILDDDATVANVAQISSTVTMAAIVKLPPTELVASKKIAMNGYWRGGVDVILSMSLREKRTATSIPKPKHPLRIMLKSIERGTMTAAFFISSDIYTLSLRL